MHCCLVAAIGHAAGAIPSFQAACRRRTPDLLPSFPASPPSRAGRAPWAHGPRARVHASRPALPGGEQLATAPAATLPEQELECVGTGSEVSCVLVDVEGGVDRSLPPVSAGWPSSPGPLLLLVLPFFLFGTSMVAMKWVLPATGPYFVASARLLPAGAAVIAFAAATGRPFPRGREAWAAIAVFALVDATCFQGCLVEGLRLVPAGLGSVIIDSQPVTVAIAASFLFGEKLAPAGRAGLVLAVLGLCLLEVPADVLLALFGAGGIDNAAAAAEGLDRSSVQTGALWMLASAQCMAAGTLIVRWVCRKADPVMATGFHLLLGGVPLLGAAAVREADVFMHLNELEPLQWASLAYMRWVRGHTHGLAMQSHFCRRIAHNPLGGTS